MYDYNTTRPPLLLKEYGRHIQKLIEQLKKMDNQNIRTQKAHAVVKLMEIMNPNAESPQKRWDDLFKISGDQLDIDIPKPKKLPSTNEFIAPIRSTEPIQYKYYGRHLTKLLRKVATLTTPKAKTTMLIVVGKLMRRFSNVWNNEYISNEKIIEHMQQILSADKLNNLDFNVIRTLPDNGMYGPYNKPPSQSKSAFYTAKSKAK